MSLKGDKKRVYQLNWITARHDKWMERLGCCIFCGTLEDVQIHHINSDEKMTHKIWSYSEDKIQGELSKCVAMCRSCHATFRGLMRRKSLKHGTSQMYKLGCKCDECRRYKAEDKRKRKSNTQ